MSAIDSEPGEGGRHQTEPVDLDPRAELRSLATALRLHAERLARGGIYAAGGGVPPSSMADAPEATMAAATAGAMVGATAGVTADTSTGTEAGTGTESEAKRVALAVVREDLGECTRCKLHTTRKKIVFGVGSAGAPLMFVGEAPGEEEDRRGEPFVGAAGQLLDRMIVAMGWTREAVYIANVLKCRPPGNRDPAPDEVAECLPFLHRQIEVLAPRIIVALGRPAAQTLLQSSAPISALRGRFHEFRGIQVMPTFHPAFLLRTPDRKRDAWSDLKQVIDELARLGVRSPHPARS
jgi:DNA polymerase